mgnify:CR=1 FL=1
MTSTLARLSILVGLLACTQVATAAVSTASRSRSTTTAEKIDLVTTKASLELPLLERLQDLRAQGPGAYDNLVSIMFNRAESMQVRWKATTAAGRIGGEKSRPALERALKSDEWFMRNAALVAMMPLDRTTGLVWARRLMNDKALVVRSAAVDALANDSASAPLLWEKLYSKENFKGRHSLFIRRRIVEALAENEKPGREAKFVALLSDKDESLHAPAIEALERITQKRLGHANEPIKFRKAKWEKWLKDSRTL